MADGITPLRGEGRTVGRITGLWGELMAEFLGCFVLIAFGDGVVAVAVAGLPGSGRTASPTTIFNAAGDWLLITWGWAMAVAFAIWVAGGVSGAHINPAVTLAFAVRRKFAWAKILPYWGPRSSGASSAPPWCGWSTTRDQPDQLREPYAEERRAGTDDIFDLRHVPGRVLPRRLRRATDRPDRRYGVPADVRRRRHRCAERGGAVQHDTADHRLYRRCDRHVLRPQRGLRHQPGRDFGPRLLAFFGGWEGWPCLGHITR